jgi:hypothetical protein
MVTSALFTVTVPEPVPELKPGHPADGLRVKLYSPATTEKTIVVELGA